MLHPELKYVNNIISLKYEFDFNLDISKLSLIRLGL